MSFEPRPHPARVARRGIGLVATAGFVALLPMMGSLSAGEDEDNVPDDGVAPDPAALNSPSASLIPETTVTATTIEVLGQASCDEFDNHDDRRSLDGSDGGNSLKDRRR